MALQKFLRRSDVQDLTGLPVSTLYEMMDRGEFPRPIRLSPRTVAWLEKDIAEWQAERVAQRDGSHHAATS